MNIFTVTGQTATGKTNFALALAAKYDGELVNCDSRQIYKKLDIITGKDLHDRHFVKTDALDSFDIGFYTFGLPSDIYHLRSTKLWLYDIVEPNRNFSAFEYVQCAIPVIKDILKRGKTPIIVGGTGFYLQHLLFDIASDRVEPNWELRRELEQKTVSELQSILTRLNPIVRTIEPMNQSDWNNPRRLMRRIEIAQTHSHFDPSVKQMKNPDGNNNSITLHQKLEQPKLKIYSYGFFYKDRTLLEEQIKSRVNRRLQDGALAEVQKLLDSGMQITDPGLQTIGYKQLIAFIQGKTTEKQAIEEWILKEIQYAKRQKTFLKKYIPMDEMKLV